MSEEASEQVPEQAEEAMESLTLPQGRQRTTSDSVPGSETDTKKLCTEDAVSSRASSMPRDVVGATATPSTVIPPSPPQVVTLAEVLRAAEGMQNMVLAHEIAVNSEFSLPEPSGPPPDGSLAARVYEMMRKAFWDLLEQELAEDPPCYKQAMTLMQEVREMLLELVPPKAKSLRTEIEEKLDIELIQQQTDSGTLNFEEYAGYVISLMAKMCCPARDDEVKALSTLKNVVPTFRGILEVLKKMKVDYANFAIREARPLIMANSVKYERKKFAEFLAAQPQGIDGLAATRTWLQRHKEEVTDTETSLSENPKVLRTRILSEAFVAALHWPTDQPYPETLAMDRDRLAKLGGQMREMVALTAVVLVTLSVVGAKLRDLTAFKQRLKDNCMILLHTENTTDDVFAQKLPGVAAQVLKDVADVLREMSLPPLPADLSQQLSGQIEALAQPSNPVRSLAYNRLRSFLLEVAASYRQRELVLPAGYSTLAKEVHELSTQFCDLVWYNMAVFGTYYLDIIGLDPPGAGANVSSYA